MRLRRVTLSGGGAILAPLKQGQRKRASTVTPINVHQADIEYSAVAQEAENCLRRGLMATNQDDGAAWEPQGYLRLANVMAKHPQLSIFRRFDMCTNISILSLQAELLSTQQDFLDLCEKCDVSRVGEEKWYTSDFYELAESDGMMGMELRESLKLLRSKTTEYNATLLQASQMAQLTSPRPECLTAMRKWLSRKSVKDGIQGRSFLRGEESALWESGNSFISLDSSPQDEDAFSKWLTPALIDSYHWLWRGRRKHADIESQDGLFNYRDSKLTRVSKSIAIIVGSALPIVAILALYFIDSLLNRIYVMIGFTILFAAAISIFTPANMVEIFASTSAFAAVEVVFIGSTAIS